VRRMCEIQNPTRFCIEPRYCPFAKQAEKLGLLSRHYFTLPYIVETELKAKRATLSSSKVEILPAHETGHRMFTSQGFNWSLWGKVYRTSFFRDAEFLQKWPHGYGEDTFINYYLLKRMRKTAYVPIQGYHYRQRETSMMHHLYHPGWMAYFEIYDEILADAREWDSQLAQDIWQVAVTACLPIRERLLRTGMRAKDAERMRAYFQKWSLEKNALWTPSLRQKWAYAATVTAEDYQARRKRWGEEIRRFSQSAPCLYLYGTGVYGTSFAEWLEELGIPWKGAIESAVHNQWFRGKPVHAIEKIAGQDVAVLVAMNEQHTREVLPLLEKAGISKSLEGWRIMY